MASITKMKSGKWQYRVSYKDENTGKFRTKSKGGFDRKTECLAAARKVEEMKSNDANLAKQDMTVHNYYNWWIETFKLPGLAESTQQRYKQLLDVIDEYFPDELLIDVTRPEYQDFLNKYGQTRSKATVKQTNTSFRGMAAEALDEGVIKHNFTRNSKVVAGIPPRDPNAKFLQIDDFEKLIKFSRSMMSFNNTSMWEVYFCTQTGCRFEESAALSWDNVDFNEETVTFSQAFSIRERKIKSTKNMSSYRKIHVSDQCMHRLKLLKQEQKEYFESIHYKNKSNFVFRNKKRQIPGNTACNTSVKKALKKANVKKIINFHDVRHTHASYLFAKGHTLLYVSKRLGHANPTITLNTYTHVMSQTLETEDNKLNSEFDNI